MLVKFKTGFFEDGKCVLIPHVIIKRYLKNDFFIDFICLFGLILCLLFKNDNY